MLSTRLAEILKNRMKEPTRNPPNLVSLPVPNLNRMGIKIGTLNLCLGLANKKNIVKQLIIEEKIDILCLQETELNINLNHDLLSFPTYCFESEINKNKSRVGDYIH